MTEETVKLVAGILAVILIGIVIMRRRAKKPSGGGDEF